MKRILTSAIALGFMKISFAGPVFNQLVEKSKFNKDEQTFCFINSDGSISGKNVHKKVRLASVTKLYTTLWAIDRLGLDYTYKTKLHINEQTKNLHIEGSKDPFFGDLKVHYILSELNRLGYKEFNKVSFNKNVYAYSRSDSYSERLNPPTMESRIEYLLNQFNTAGWEDGHRYRYIRSTKWARDAKDRKCDLSSEIEMKAGSVALESTEDFKKANSAYRTFELSSAPMHAYLKRLNVKSNNYVSQMLFLQLGNHDRFKTYLEKKLNITDKKVSILTGSGMNVTIKKKRHDNTATCAITLKIVQEIQDRMVREADHMKKIIAVPGSDLGTFKKRLRQSIVKNSMIAKTGTLKHTSTLAGMIYSQSGERPFAIINHTSQAWKARKLQDELVVALFKGWGGPKKFDYERNDFFSSQDQLTETTTDEMEKAILANKQAAAAKEIIKEVASEEKEEEETQVEAEVSNESAEAEDKVEADQPKENIEGEEEVATK